MCFFKIFTFLLFAFWLPRGFIPPDKTQPASLLNDFKDIPGKACLKGVHNNDAFVNVGN